MLLRFGAMAVIALRVAAIRGALLVPAVLLRNGRRRGQRRGLVLLVAERVRRDRGRESRAARFICLAKTANVGCLLLRECPVA